MIQAAWTISFEDANHAVRGICLFNLLSRAHYPVGKVNEATCHLHSSILILMLKTSYRDCSALTDNKMPKPNAQSNTISVFINFCSVEPSGLAQSETIFYKRESS
ncbi:hypothetical protein AVEN_165394-1 [Araneus ventricosus]|uniref:Uncharacterized protein n=1 Tax=Araneus ventricosus TaxID=182803 RepID=A0A4Y2AWC9_ARAVE|nr:hypothetical protein AVEN_165394-1 [Araneus ventricosus]